MITIATKWVYDFSEGSREMRELLGGKGSGIAEMTRVLEPGLVPAGFTITTEACVAYMRDGDVPAGFADAVDAAIARLESQAGRRLGDPGDPLLVSVRSGARDSMPGMMDTVLNLGLNDESVAGLAEATGNARFAWDSYRRLVQMFGDVVCGVPGVAFEDEIAAIKAERGVRLDTELDVEALTELTRRFQALYDFPQDPREQLERAIRAVFDSWMGDRAVAYRRINGIPDDWGTAVNVQQMVFGNKGSRSGSGVAFSRDEVTGAPEPSGDFLIDAQGEDVVSGVRTPLDLSELAGWMPDAHQRLRDILRTLERHYKDMQDTEFTIEDGRLYMLQTRNAKRPAQAAVRFAVDAVEEGLLTRAEAIGTIDAGALDALLHPTFDPPSPTPRSPAASRLRRARPRARSCSPRPRPWRPPRRRRDVILVRPFTEADDVAGFHAAKGILTSEGGKASHAALVARGMGRPAVTGARGGRDRPPRRVGADRRPPAARGRPDRDRRVHRRRHARRRPARQPEGRRALRDRPRLVRRAAHPRGARQRRHARGRAPRARLRRRGDRPLPHRAHVHGRRAPAQDAADDHGRGRGRPSGRARRAAAAPAGGLRGPARGDGRPAGDDPPARPAAARVHARSLRARRAPRRGARRGRRRHGARAQPRARAVAGRGQPDARDARRAPRPRPPRDLRDAGARDLPCREGGAPTRPRAGTAGDHGPARRVRR